MASKGCVGYQEFPVCMCVCVLGIYLAHFKTFEKQLTVAVLEI